jgi:hypothetical protein
MDREVSEDKLARILRRVSLQEMTSIYNKWLFNFTDRTPVHDLLDKHGWTYEEFIEKRE